MTHEPESDLEISFINHASLLIHIKSDDQYVLTDPWYISPAFGNWTQRPGPTRGDIEAIVNIDPSKLSVCISHGHDDHLDEYFISHHLRDSKFLVPKFSTGGFKKRIANLIASDPVEVDETPYRMGSLSVAAFINYDFTHHDSIMAIRNDTEAVIHANDNWHAYPSELIDQIEPFLGDLERANVRYFVQFGIADCFPVNYPDIAMPEKMDIIFERFDSYLNSTIINQKNLCISFENSFYYANQSRYDFPGDYESKSPYELASKFVEERGGFRQCQPGALIAKAGAIDDQRAAGSDEPLFDFLMRKAEKFLNEKSSFHLPLHLAYDEASIDPECVNYLTSRLNWQRILIGDITFESITIGGLGRIYKPANVNIRDLHIAVSKLSYLFQAKVKADGLRFLMEV